MIASPTARGQRRVSPGRPTAGQSWLAPLGIGLAGLAVLVYLSLLTDLPFSDEYARQWTLRRLAAGQGIALWGGNAGLVQLALAAPLALLHTLPRFWRMPGLLLLPVAGAYGWRLAARFGADRFWSCVAAVSVVAAPLTLSVATGMMNETTYIGLVLAATWYALCWVEDGRCRALTIALTALATLQRPQAMAMIVAVTLGLFLVRRARKVDRRDAVALAFLVGACLIAYRLPQSLRPVAVTGGGTHGPTGVSLVFLTTLYMVTTLGLLVCPFAAGLLSLPDAERRRVSRLEMLPVVLAMFVLTGGLGLLLAGRPMVFPGGWVNPWGLGPNTLESPKPSPFPAPLFVALQAAALVTIAIVFIWRRRGWEPRNLGVGRGFVVIAAAGQFAPFIFYPDTFDRYYIPVAALLAPVLAAMVRRGAGDRPARAWALGALVAGVVLYAVGAQDYVAWQVARNTAAEIAYARYGPNQVVAGFEETAVHVWIPAVDNPGQRLPVTVDDPRVILVFAAPGDPRAGADYHSLASGRVVLQELRSPGSGVPR
jgi:hypothetical protein